jgi:type IV pilus assembly protein PilO
VALKTGLEGKPWYIGLAVGLAAGLLLFGLGYWQYVQPKNDEYAALEVQLGELQNKIQEGRAARQELPKFREEVRQLELELDKLLRILPARRNTPDLMRRIRSLTEQGDFALAKFNPGTLTDKEFFSEWPIAVNVRGSYHNLALFFDRISRFSRIINIENLEILALPPSKEGHTLSASFTAKTFVYKESEPAAPAGAPAGGPVRGAPGSAPPAEGPAASIRSGAAAAAGGSEQ